MQLFLHHDGLIWMFFCTVYRFFWQFESFPESFMQELGIAYKISRCSYDPTLFRASARNY